MSSKMIFSQSKSLYYLFRAHSSTSQFYVNRMLVFLPSVACYVFENGSSLRSSKFQRLFSQVPSHPNPSTDDVNEICRVLSDFRSPHHDIESALSCFSNRITTNLVEQVLKRCKNLGVSAHRFFFWAQRVQGFSHSRESYEILVDILGSSKQFPLIWDLLSEMRDAGDLEVEPKMFWSIFRAYCKADLPTDAIRAFTRMDDFGLKSHIDDLNQLLFTLCKKKFVKFAQEFFEKVKFEYSPSPKTYSILMMGWGDVGDSIEARKLYAEMVERGCTLDVIAYNTLLDSLCRGGNADEAYRFFREMKSHGLNPDTRTYAVFVRAACEANDIHSALRVLDRMRRYNLVPNVFTYNCIVKLLCKNERVDDAYLLLDEMLERGASPDVWSYNAIQAFHCDHCEVNRALKLISRMEKDGCMPDRHTYNMVLKMLIRLGRFDRAMTVWESMGGRGFYASVSTYAVMIHGLCKKKGRVEDACRYFEMMIDEGIPPYHCTCTVLRDRLLSLGFCEKTQILADKMQQSTSCTIQELSSTMKGDKKHVVSINEEPDSRWYETH